MKPSAYRRSDPILMEFAMLFLALAACRLLPPAWTLVAADTDPVCLAQCGEMRPLWYSRGDEPGECLCSPGGAR